MNGRIGKLEAHDDDLLAAMDEVGGGAVHLDRAGAAFACDGVGFKASTGGIADDEDFFAAFEADRFHESDIDGDASDVFDIGFGDRGIVNFGPEKPAHNFPSRLPLRRADAVALSSMVCAGGGAMKGRGIVGVIRCGAFRKNSAELG